MDTWMTETTMDHERVPAWLVEFAQLWTCQSATTPHYHEEYQQIKQLASAANVPPFIIALRLFRDTYLVHPDTTWDQFLSCIDTQIATDDGQLLLHLDRLPTEAGQRAAAAKELQDTAVGAVDARNRPSRLMTMLPFGAPPHTAARYKNRGSSSPTT